MRNAALHGHAREIVLKMEYLRDGIQIEISDDGCGFILEEGSNKIGHWGIAGMQERAHQIGAELKIATSPGSGTRVSIMVPSST
jgi:signal transduction histidine kinase